jgi:hypothetical protein
MDGAFALGIAFATDQFLEVWLGLGKVGMFGILRFESIAAVLTALES